MTSALRLRDLVPRRSEGLPPGQREVRAFPRFSDKPLLPPPRETEVDVAISVEGVALARLGTDDLAGFERVEQVSDFHCVTTWTYRNARWGGVRFMDVVRSVLPDPVEFLPFAVASAADGARSIYVTADLTGDDVLLATHLGGAPLDGRHGAPVRLISPGQYGYKNPKHLTGIDFRQEQPESTLGPKEHLRARVDLEERHATLPNWLVRVPYRLIVAPTALAGERALDTQDRRRESAPVLRLGR